MAVIVMYASENLGTKGKYNTKITMIWKKYPKENF
jgi:hypothetical protein